MPTTVKPFGPRISENGKTAARSIHEFLGGSVPEPKLRVEIHRVPADLHRMPSGYERRLRESAPTVETGRRTGITEVENVMDAEQAVRQAERCLHCHVDTIYDPLLCVLCNRCADISISVRAWCPYI